MTHRTRGLLVAVAATLTVAAATQAFAASVDRSALPNVTLAAADFGGATPIRSVYETPPKGARATYARLFGGVYTTAGHIALRDVEVVLTLANTTPGARSFYHDVHLLYVSKLGHKLLAAEIARSFAAKGVKLTARDLRFGHAHSVDAGAESVLEPVRITLATGTLHDALVAIRIGPVLAILDVVADGAGSAPAARALAGTLAGRIQARLSGSTLPTTGPTSPGGVTGATGATGATA